MATYPHVKLGPVQWGTDGYGFNITDEHSGSLFAFVYATQADAEAGRDALGRALANIVQVVTTGTPPKYCA
jgi:hypothetical protein